MIPKWHWTNKPEEEKKEILKRMSKGWKNLELRPKKNRVKCKCLICGKEFEVKKSRFLNGRGKYCSKECYNNRKIVIKRKCLYCKKPFLTTKTRIEDKRGIYCSKKCFYKDPIHREKLSKAITGKKHNEKTRKKISKFLEKRKYLETTRKKMSKIMSGKRNPSWLGGTSFEPYGLEFNKILKEQIRKRDGYRCQQCFRHQDELYTKTGQKYKLPVHHIDYNKKNNDQSNLISLCGNCHGQTNFGRKDWTNYFKGKTIST